MNVHDEATLSIRDALPPDTTPPAKLDNKE
jgi:hypothetical protein